ncbi:MAG: P-type DNA transfer protein VirB5 [Steroidobacteraceae bacterium]
MRRQILRFFLVFSFLAVIAPAAHAQFAVIDVASLTQLVSQLQTLEQPLATARGQLSQAQQEYQSMTGGRGMQNLLAGTVRNYLPGDWPSLQAVLNGTGGAYPALATDVRSALAATSVLSAGQLSAFAPADSVQLQAGRQTPALLQSVTSEALANASARFTALQQLIDAIGGAADPKAVLDLQARIAAEAAMLQNEHTKLQALYQVLQARQWADSQRGRELAIAGHGQFTSRFQPQP